MTITLWAAPFEIFSSSSGPITSVHWLKSRFSGANSPAIIDAETPASTYNAGGANDYTIMLSAENFEGDVQAPSLVVGTTGDISLPFAPMSATLVASSPTGQNEGAAIWWQASTTTPGTYDIEFQNYSDNVTDVASTTPALQLLGAPTTLATSVSNPLLWAYALNSEYLVYLYATAASSTTENLTLQVFTTTGGAAVTSPITVATGVARSGFNAVDYFSATGAFDLVQTATVNGVQGIDFTPITPTTGALGAPLFQPFSLSGGPTGSDPIVIDRVTFSKLTNGDILEFVSWRDTAGFPYWQGVTTRLLNSSLTDISSSTSTFQSGGFANIGQETPAHWSIATLANGDTVFVYSLNGLVSMELFGSSGNQTGSTYSFSPPNSTFPPSDFDSVVAMGGRFEITYSLPDATNGGTDEFAVIYDTATGGASYTINDASDPTGRWVGTPFNDKISYGAGVNEINGGGGTDTFVATGFASSQASVVVNAQGNVVFSDAIGDVDTLERFSTIQLADSTIQISGNQLTQTFLNGDTTVSNFNIAGQAYSGLAVTRDASGALIGSDVYYTANGGASYSSEEVELDGAGLLTRLVFTGVSGEPYSSDQYDYVGGVFAGSTYTVTNVPAGATYSAYILDYSASSTFAGDQFFFSTPASASYTGEEEDFDANGQLSRVVLTGVESQAYSTLELDYSAGAYEGYKAFYTNISGQSYTAEEVDASAGGQIEKVVVSGMTSTPYSAVEQDYANGKPAAMIIDYTSVSGASYDAYQLEVDANGAAEQERFDLDSGGHDLIALTGGQTLTSLGDDEMTGSGATTFVLGAIYGADTIANFSNADTVSLPSQEYAQLSAAIQNATYAGGDATLQFSDGDRLSFNGVTQATLTSLIGNFTAHS